VLYGFTPFDPAEFRVYPRFLVIAANNRLSGLLRHRPPGILPGMAHELHCVAYCYQNAQSVAR
jgi:hypothetical protein